MNVTKSILVPTTGMGVAEETVDFVMKVAKALDADVIALHIIRPGHAKEYAEHVSDVFDRAGKELQINVTCEVREGQMIHEIIVFAEENDVSIILMGASNGEVFDRWVNSEIRDQTSIPALVIPYQVFNYK